MPAPIRHRGLIPLTRENHCRPRSRSTRLIRSRGKGHRLLPAQLGGSGSSRSRGKSRLRAGTKRYHGSSRSRGKPLDVHVKLLIMRSSPLTRENRKEEHRSSPQSAHPLTRGKTIRTRSASRTAGLIRSRPGKTRVDHPVVDQHSSSRSRGKTIRTRSASRCRGSSCTREALQVMTSPVGDHRS